MNTIITYYTKVNVTCIARIDSILLLLVAVPYELEQVFYIYLRPSLVCLHFMKIVQSQNQLTFSPRQCSVDTLPRYDSFYFCHGDAILLCAFFCLPASLIRVFSVCLRARFNRNLLKLHFLSLSLSFSHVNLASNLVRIECTNISNRRNRFL